MAQEKKTPAFKPVPISNANKDGGHSTLTTPKKDTNGNYQGGKEQKGSILK